MAVVIELPPDKVKRNTKTKEEIINLFKNKVIDKDWSFIDYKPSDTGKWTHDYHRYPAKFIPQLVEKLMDECLLTSQDVHINDPFMGSGTTIVSAISRGFKASGTDINKVAYLITKVKSTPIEPEYLHRKIEWIISKINRLEAPLFSDEVEPFIPKNYIERIRYWFPEENIDALGKILRIIYDEKDEVIKDFFLVAFSHILKNCSLWLKDSTKPTRDLTKKPASPYEAFKKHLMKMYAGNNDFFRVVPKQVTKNIKKYLNIKIGDAKNQPVPEESINLIITSSPYVTSYEYADLHQLSTIWLELADDMTEYKSQFIGTSYKKDYNQCIKSSIARKIVEQMSLKNTKMSKEIGAFFSDMEEVFKESFRILKYGGRCCFVIGNTRLKGVEILNAEVFAESLQYTGFTIERIIKREIPSKILPQKRDERTGRFASNHSANSEAYPVEYILIGLKE